jgi:hypothetical protein
MNVELYGGSALGRYYVHVSDIEVGCRCKRKLGVVKQHEFYLSNNIGEHPIFVVMTGSKDGNSLQAHRDVFAIDWDEDKTEALKKAYKWARKWAEDIARPLGVKINDETDEGKLAKIVA